MVFHIAIFILSALSFILSGQLIINGLIKLAKFLNWREFAVGFLVMSLAASLPNLFVGVSSALRGIPELSFGDIIGGNVVDLTLVTSLGIILSGGILAGSRVVQTSAVFTAVTALLPLVLVIDDNLGRLDGLILLGVFFFYCWWLFGKQERFREIHPQPPKSDGGTFRKSLAGLILGLVLLLAGSQGIVSSALFFAEKLALPLGLVGILIVGLGNALPETYFTIIAAKKREAWLALGDLFGAVIACATLVLGVVALIAPIKINDFSPYLLARIFLILATVFFLIFLRSDKKLTRKEGLFLLGLYVLFLLSEIFFQASR